MKRKNGDEQPSRRSKRRLTAAEHGNGSDDGHEPDAHSDADAQSSAGSYVDSGAESDGEDDDDDSRSTPATTITRAGNTGSGPPSTSTAASRKVFPSMLKTIKCTHPGCPKTFNRPARLAAHLRSHTGDRALKCPHEGCDKAYFNEKHLKQHIKGSHTGERQYVCPEPGCDKTFLTGTRLRRHAVVHSGQGRFRCTNHGPCDKVFRKHQTLQRHVRADHLGQPAFACSHDNCGAGFDTANTLRKHVQREHGELRFWCDECGKEDGEAGRRTGFTTMNLLMVHMRRCHVDCLFCDVRCGSQWELERHIEMHHSGASAADRKVVACTWDGCTKKFTRRANLNVHVRMVHEGYRFVCGEVGFPDSPELVAAGWGGGGDGDGDGDALGNGAACGSGFHTKRRLEDHIRVAHLGIERLAKTIREDANDGDISLKPAGLFSMYASTATAGWDENDEGLLFAAASQQMPSYATAVPAEQQQVPTSTDLFCSQPDCFQVFSSMEERDEHVQQLHPRSRDGFAEHPAPMSPPTWTESPPVGVQFPAAAEDASPYAPDGLPTVDGTNNPMFTQTVFEGQNLSNRGVFGEEPIYDAGYQAINKIDELSALVDPSLFT